MVKIIKNGQAVNVNYCGRDAQARMIRNGWRIELCESYGESAQALYDRLAATGCYSDIRIYWDATAIRGLHSYFAFVKR